MHVLGDAVLSMIPEKAFQASLVRLARLLDYHVYHPFDSRRSEAGFPDLVLLRPPRLIFVEVKSERGRVTEAQRAWLDALRGCPSVEAYVWRPSDADRAYQILQRGEAALNQEEES